MNRIYNRRELQTRRQTLRSQMPPAEVLLWQQIHGKQLLGYKFRRQYSVGRYVLDFYCPALRLGIELDGDSHFQEGAAQRDQERDSYISSFGIRLVRFLNTDVFENMEGLLEVLLREIRVCEDDEGTNPP
jgi:very-short-patch-repair endonuclease